MIIQINNSIKKKEYKLYNINLFVSIIIISLISVSFTNETIFNWNKQIDIENNEKIWKEMKWKK